LVRWEAVVMRLIFGVVTNRIAVIARLKIRKPNCDIG